MRCPLVYCGDRPLPPGWRSDFVVRDEGDRVLAFPTDLEDSPLLVVVDVPQPEEFLDGEAANVYRRQAVCDAERHAADVAWERWQASSAWSLEDVPLPPGWLLYRGACECGGPLWTAASRRRTTRSDRLGEVVRVAWHDHREGALVERVLVVCVGVVAAAALLAFGVFVTGGFG